jgi:uncharacterized membrane protein
MEALAVLLVPLALGYLAAPVIALVMAANNRTRARELANRISGLEVRLNAALAAGAAPAAQPARPPAAEPPAPRPDVMQTLDIEAPAPEAPQPSPPPAAAAPPPASPPVQQAAPSAQTAPPPRPPAPARGESLEQTVGTRWVVWVGGVALALGGIFLVNFAIEQGLLGPRVRVALASLLAAALIVLGEWARRSEKISGFAGVPSAHVPSILTAVGTTIAFATVYAAFALYELIGPAVAFVLLGIVAIATLAAALLHGPALAALGLVGAEVTPLLVSTDEPNYWALYIYLAVVTAAALALARVRLWRWLALTAVVAGVLWSLPGIDETATNVLAPHVFHFVVSFGLLALLVVAGFMFGPDTIDDVIDPVSSGALAAFVAVAALSVVAVNHDGLALTAFTVLVIAAVGVAWCAESAAAVVPAAAILTALVMAAFAVEREVIQLIAPGGASAGAGGPEPNEFKVTTHLVLGAGFAALFGGTGFMAQGRFGRPQPPMCWAAASAFAPLAILAALYYRIAGFERSIPFAALALLLAALFTVATEILNRRPQRPGIAAAQAIYATGAVAALALALTLALEKGWLTIGLALMVLGVAWVERERALPALRWLAALIVALVIARIVWEPRIVGSDVGTTPVFNWLLYGYGIPALAFWGGGYLLRKRADDTPARIVDAAAILFTVLLVTLEIRHFISNGNIYNASSTLTEIALQVCAGLAMTIGLEHIRGRTNSIVHDVGALIVGALTLCAIVLGLMLTVNPMLTPRPVGPAFFNTLLLGYGIPAVLATILALRARTTRPVPYRVVAAVTSVVLSLMYITFEIARLFQGPVIANRYVSDAQQYSYSAAWLVYGVALLTAGLLLPSKPARIASGAVILLTVLKVFLLDMAGLSGIWRALSFIGLGIVLIGIGYLYQRLLFPTRAPGSPVPPEDHAAEQA